ncbi:MAG: hypothetical protein Q7T08_06925 [Devosia sp.]|nr:hypothetical protein [Devosia sp.]
MNEKAERRDELEDTLAEGFAAVMAADEAFSHPEDMADLFLEELNRLWADPAPLEAL